MNNKKCSSIILNYNSIKDTKELVNDLQKNNEIDKIVIVDNNSTDDSFVRLKRNFRDYKDVFIIKTNENLGYSYGNNYGAKFLLNNFNPEYILISNPDVKIPKNFVNSMINYLENDSNLAAVTGLMLDYRKKLNFSQIAWKIPNLIDYTILNLEVLIKLYNPIKYHYLDFMGNNKGLSYVECLPGSCFVIRSEILRKIGFFDENVFLYCEEVILGKNIQNLGLTNGLSFNEFFVHKHLKKRSLNAEMKNYLILYKSRFYYILTYTKLGKLFSPIFLLTISLGLLEKLVILCFKTLIKSFRGRSND